MVPSAALPSSRDVAALAAAAQAGSREAFAALVDRYTGSLLTYLRLRARSEEDAQELAQETFLRAWQCLARYDPRWRFSTWLFTVGQRLSVSRYRRLAAPITGTDLPEGVAPDDPLRAASAAELRADLWGLADVLLSPAARQALWLRYVEGFSAGEIARVLGKRAATVRVMLFRARERLAPHLAAHAPEPSSRAAPEPAQARP